MLSAQQTQQAVTLCNDPARMRSLMGAERGKGRAALLCCVPTCRGTADATRAGLAPEHMAVFWRLQASAQLKPAAPRRWPYVQGRERP